MSDKLTCVYVSDRGFLPCTSFSIASLVRYASQPLQIIVLYTDTDTAALAKAEGYLARIGAPVTFVTVTTEAFAGLPPPKQLPLATYGRLLMDRLLPADLARVLYIDGDTLVDIDVAPLAQRSLLGKPVGAVLDIGRILVGRREEAQKRLELGPNGDYFNAGVLLIDWPQWRAKSIGEATVRALLAEPQRFVQADQCGLNYTCRGSWAQLDFCWNYQPSSVLYQDRQQAIFHFLGSRKPWVGTQNRHPMRFVQRYEALYADSPWPEQFSKPALPYWAKAAYRFLHNKGATRYWANRSLYHQTAQRIADEIAAAGRAA